VLRQHPDCPKKFASELADGGWVTWTKPKQSNSMVQLDHSYVQWNNLVQGLNKMTILEFQGWLTASLTVRSQGVYQFYMGGVHSFFINGALFPGDVYRNDADYGSVVVHLPEGVHHLQMRIRGKQNVNIDYSIRFLHAHVDWSAVVASSTQVSSGVHPSFFFRAHTPSLRNSEPTDVYEDTLPFGSASFLQLPVSNWNVFWIRDVIPCWFPFPSQRGPPCVPPPS